MTKKVDFPRWVETPKRQSKESLATKRLQYLLCRAALATVPGGSITEFAAKAGVERSSLHTFVRKGEFSAKTAVAIEEFVGRDHTPHEFLRNPLGIATA